MARICCTFPWMQRRCSRSLRTWKDPSEAMPLGGLVMQIFLLLSGMHRGCAVSCSHWLYC
jgi:hypothetical protein